MKSPRTILPDPEQMSLEPTNVYPLRETNGVYYFEPVEGPAGDDQGKSLLYYWSLLKEKKAIVIMFLIGGLGLGWLSAQMQTPAYRSLAAIEIQSMDQSDAIYGIIERDWTGGAGGSTLGAEAYLQTQIELLNSRTFVRRVFDNLEKKVRPEGDGLPKNPMKAALVQAGVLNRVKDDGKLPGVDLSIAIRPNTHIVNISAESADREFAAEVANSMAQEFINYNDELQTLTAEKTMAWLREQLDAMRVKVEEAERALQEYGDEVGLLFEAEQPESEKRKLEDLQRQLAAASAARIDKQASYEVTAAGAVAGTAGAFGDLSRYKTQLTELETTLALLKKKFTDKHKDVIETQEKIAAIKQLMNSEIAERVDLSRAEYEAASLRERYLLDSYHSQLGRVSSTAEKAVQYEILEGELDRRRKLYENLMEKATTLSISTAMRASSQIRFVETAEPPNRPYSPRLQLNLAFGLVSGLMMGLGLVWFDDYSNQRLRSPSESEMVLKLPQLGSIPPASGRNALETRPDRKLFSRLRRALPGTAQQIEDPTPVAVGWIDSRRNGGGNRRIAEAFHGVVASVLATLRHSGGSRVLMVTSAFEGDGKTTVASQLACALAEVGHDVLLIDGDMRAPSLHTVFGLTNDMGLSGLFVAPALRDDFFEPSGPGDPPNYIHRTKVERLDLLPAGTPPKSAVITLHSPRLGEIIARQRMNYDFVIVDTPPMMQVSDARILGRHADAAILVLRSGKTPRGAAVTVKRRLADDRLPVLGTVLNGWEPAQGKSNYYYG